MGFYTNKYAEKANFIVIVGVILLAGATGGRANTVPISASYLGLEGIEYYIQTNKAVYDVGEDVEFLLY